MAHVSQKPAPPSKHRPGCPRLSSIILDALAKDPSARPKTCGEMRERLLAAIPDEAPSIQDGLAGAVDPLPHVLHDTDGGGLVLVPAGPFQMGPSRREVHLDAFYIDRTPVTNAQFRAFLSVTGYRPKDEGAGRFLAHWARGAIPRGLEHHPVFVSWVDARAYASWAGKRLPTEAEWEKAAPGGRTNPVGQERAYAFQGEFRAARARHGARGHVSRGDFAVRRA